MLCPLEAYTVPSDTMRACPQGRGIQVSPAQDPLGSVSQVHGILSGRHFTICLWEATEVDSLDQQLKREGGLLLFGIEGFFRWFDRSLEGVPSVHMRTLKVYIFIHRIVCILRFFVLVFVCV